MLGATLLSRYSEFNLGQSYSSPQAYSRSMLKQMSRQSALCLMTAMINDAEGKFGSALHPRNRALLERMFANEVDSDGGETKPPWLAMTAQLNVPVIGIGAPAQSFYPPIAEFLDAEVVVPELSLIHI